MQYELINVTTDRRGIVRLELDRVSKGNAYNDKLLDELNLEFDRISEDLSLRALVLVGAGKNFQCGADLHWLEEVSHNGEIENEKASVKTYEVIQKLNLLQLPTVALVQGLCAGGGTGLIAACDIVLSEKTAFFSISEVRWGLNASIILPVLNAAIGTRNVRRYGLTGERFDAFKALSLGLVHELAEPGALESRVEDVILELLKSSPSAIRATKAGIVKSAWAPDSKVRDYLVKEHASIRQSASAVEGFASFFEGRKAQWWNGSGSDN